MPDNTFPPKGSVALVPIGQPSKVEEACQLIDRLNNLINEMGAKDLLIVSAHLDKLDWDK